MKRKEVMSLKAKRVACEKSLSAGSVQHLKFNVFRMLDCQAITIQSSSKYFWCFDLSKMMFWTFCS